MYPRWLDKLNTHLSRQADTSFGAVFFKDTTKDDALIDTCLLLAILDDIAPSIQSFLEDPEVELSLAADIVLDSFCLCNKCRSVLRVEHLGGSRVIADR